jgi:signal transduction histidine kinase
MILNKVLASYTFRFMSIYVAGLSFSCLIVLTVLYTSYSYENFQDLGPSISKQMDEFQAVYETDGVNAVKLFLNERVSVSQFNRFHYLIVDTNYEKIAGSLDAWPVYRDYGDDWVSYQIDVLSWDLTSTEVPFLGQSRLLENGDYLLVARHSIDVIYIINVIKGVLLRSLIVTIVLGTIGGVIVAGLSVNRIDSINKNVKRIMSGDLSQRIDGVNQQGDYRELTTNLNLMLDRIQMLMQGIRQVSDNIAHDLRTPLTRLRNNLAQLQDRPDDNTEKTIRNLINEADDLLSTFNALLRISHIESGKQRAGFISVDLKTILLDIIEFYEPLALGKSITMTQNISDGIEIQGDRHLLFQAFANVIDNAIKYTPEGGLLAVGLEIVDADVKVTISDTGLGIPEQERAKVFRRFFRIEESRSMQPGNGLGLSLVSAAVTLHGGEIVLSDNHPGLNFEISIPVLLSA